MTRSAKSAPDQPADGRTSTRSRLIGSPRAVTRRSRVTNGKQLFVTLRDNDNVVTRRLKDLLSEHVSDLGGLDNISSSELALIRMVSQLRLRLELIEQRWAANGEATDKSLETYQRVSNTLRRHLVTLGLHRRPKDVPSLSQYLRTKTIDAEDAEAEP